MAAAPVARAVGVPRVLGHVQEIWSRPDAVALTPLALACHQLLAISTPVHEHLPRALQSRTTVLVNATPEPPGGAAPKPPDGPLRFVVASRWNGWKGHRTLLRAWDVTPPPGVLTVLGGPPPSGDSVDVPDLVRRLRHPRSVEVVGEVADIGPHLDRADVVLMPSDRPEPFGLVAIEAFARARPVVASAGGGLADIVSDGVDGWLFEPGDAGALARVLRSVSRSEAVRRGARARQAYELRFTSVRYAEQWRRTVGV